MDLFLPWVLNFKVLILWPGHFSEAFWNQVQLLRSLVVDWWPHLLLKTGIYCKSGHRKDTPGSRRSQEYGRHLRTMAWPPLCLSPGEGGRDLPVSLHSEITGVWLAWGRSHLPRCACHIKNHQPGSEVGRKILALLACKDRDMGLSSLQANCPETGMEIFLCRYESHTLDKNWTCLLHWECPSVNTGFFKGRLKIKTHNLQESVLNYPHWGYFLLLYMPLASAACYQVHTILIPIQAFNHPYYSISLVCAIRFCPSKAYKLLEGRNAGS